MQDFSISPKEIIFSTWKNRDLIKALVKREIISRYRGSVFGILWSLFNPILMLVIYTFIFSVVFKARWQSGGESKAEFALVLFAGLIVFNFFAECINRAPNLILTNSNYVKKILFPLELLPLVSIGTALFHTLTSISVWLIFYCVEIGPPRVSIILLPFVLIPLILLVSGLSWIFSSLAVYLRDIGQIISVLTTVLMFLSPIFFSASVLPEKYQRLLLLNPLAPAINQMRDILYWGEPINILNYIAYLITCSAISWIGFIWFQKTRKGFADVL